MEFEAYDNFSIVTSYNSVNSDVVLGGSFSWTSTIETLNFSKIILTLKFPLKGFIEWVEKSSG